NSTLQQNQKYGVCGLIKIFKINNLEENTTDYINTTIGKRKDCIMKIILLIAIVFKKINVKIE
ncbi:hypothetical protein, partial [Staphylococcus capitis]|uniref:hypothetical protein n=1 Tax=Staphylococcus capitis TaxID=29388 RepID=UPI00066DBCFD